MKAAKEAKRMKVVKKKSIANITKWRGLSKTAGKVLQQKGKMLPLAAKERAKAKAVADKEKEKAKAIALKEKEKAKAAELKAKEKAKAAALKQRPHR